ncbi:cytochrome P450 [Actinomadura livida]|uniref:Cytochrome P450 n=1 Tax=Actinomadura livida TaxID=79909 RepID=A0A7W7IEZ8_9ACTN|nr:MULTISPECIES: cytochrome P450 [Actinomadura]MBB4775888.1 cytochrome P450 [Actinomadura catellatispora]GGU39163.1 cytochrome P450 [Actinomadura livida]
MTQQKDVSPAPPRPESGRAALLEWLRWMRDHQPVALDETTGMWQLFRYDDIHRSHTDLTDFSAELGRVLPLGELSRGVLAVMDPPRHGQVRALVSQAFTPRTVARLEPHVAELTRRLLDEAAGQDEVELMRALAYPLPISIIAELLGVPRQDREMFRRWADTRLSGDHEAEAVFDDDTIRASVDEMHAYLLEHVRARRQRPSDDLISRLALAEVGGDRLDDQEIVHFTGLLLMAGYTTVAAMLGNAVLLLHDNPAAADALRADPGLIPGAVEEVVRYYPPLPQSLKLLKNDVELHGTTMPAGSLVTTWTLSANHDERHIADPGTFDIRRDPNPHVGFGHGIHFCLGASLARLEGRIALEALLARLPGPRVLREPEMYPNPRILAPREVWVATGG